ncbi:MAG: hypothetical protein JNL67_05770 [Planctomycetaceae bacterium]|nr:hypothetical protein [Planctomycetaceae bacterium]
MSEPLPRPFVTDYCRAAIEVGFHHFLRHFVGLGLVFATLSASLFLTVDRVGSSLKHLVEQRANQILGQSGWQVEFESLQFVEGEGIRLRGLQFRCNVAQTESYRLPVPHGWTELQSLVRQGRLPITKAALASHNGPRQVTQRPNFRPALPETSPSPVPLAAGPTLKIDSLWLRGDWSTPELIQGHFHPKSVELDGVVVDLPMGWDQQLSIPKFQIPTTHAIASTPEKVSLENVVLQISDENGRPLYRLAGLQCHVSRDTQIEPGSSDPALPQATPVAEAWRLRAQFNGPADQPIYLDGCVDRTGYDLSVRCAPFYWHPQTSAKLLPWLPPQAQVLGGVSGQVRLDQAKCRGAWPHGQLNQGQAAAASEVKKPHLGIQEFIAVGQLSEVVVQHGLLPQPILNGGAKFEVTAAGARVTEVSGAVSEGAFAGWIEVVDWSAPQVQIQVRGQRLPFSSRWTGVLSERLQQAWNTFRPEGEFDCDLSFVLQPDGSLNRRGTVDARDVSFLYRDFPLPVAQVNGRIHLEDNNCTFKLEANDPECPVIFEGWANDMGPKWTGRIDVRSARFHPFSESLLEGLRNKPEAVNVIKQMNFAGMLAANGFIEKARALEPADVRFNVSVQNGEIRHQIFPYRMFGLAGMIQFVNGTVTAEKVEGVSSTGNITISGQSVPGKQWWVNIAGQAVELNQELYQALSPNQKSVWTQLSPRGTLDNLLVRVQNLGSGVQVSVDAYQQPSTPRDPSNLRIEPSWFRYALDRLSGKFHYSNGEIQISDVHGWHGNVPISFDAAGQSHAEYWQMTVRDLLTGQIPIDHEILDALPTSVQMAANRMQLTGSVAVQGTVSIFQRLRKSATSEVVQADDPGIVQVNYETPEAEVSFRPGLSWDLRVDVENAKAMLGVPVEHIHGHVQLRGLSNQETAYCGGQIDLDSAMVQGLQTTTIQGPYWCNEQNVLFGTAVGNLPTEIQAQTCGSIASLTANSLGGRLSMDGQVWLQEDTRFQIQSTASQIDLARLAAEFAPQTREIVGNGTASVILSGSAVGTHTLDGQGMIRINDAKLYEIPFFLQLLKTLQVKTPDKTAFDEGSIDFKIQGPDIECRRIELKGDAITLIGNGRANLSQELDLNFYTVLGRNNYYVPLVSDLIHAGSQQLLWISVKGTAENPQLNRETFRALNEAVRLMLEEQE